MPRSPGCRHRLASTATSRRAGLRFIWLFSPPGDWTDFRDLALVGVLLFGILNGVVVAAVVSILLLLHHAAQPHVAFLGRIPGTRRFSDLARHRDNEQIPGVLAFRVESPIVYFNVDHVLRIVLDRVEAEAKSLRLIVCDLSTSPTVDLAGRGCSWISTLKLPSAE